MNGLVAKGIARPHLSGALDITVASGEIVGLIGPNGSGKTTLLRALAGLTAGDGSIHINGTPLAAMTSSQRARRIAFMPAGRRVDWPMRVDDIVALSGAGGDAVAGALGRVGMSAFASRRVDTLSTGERARALLARVLAGNADWLLLDEPTANLDPGHELDVLAVLRAEAARGAGVLASFHNLALAETHCDRCVLMADGRIVAEGVPAAVLTDANLVAVYGIVRDGAGWRRSAS
ncbi:ABC transporter ATP-binding protein [Sphingosinicella soli]|uniref:Iron complex transport system ATP-binding protein n=1 Tax=Sphingosinicella soli TaxID=333708 RepID=A0A7W7F7E5_9SPHN|nr:ABC transporter ATP-binding protein [Sphingosinicella soli]MBB4630563.1 iron complex transport system ATP-binding protein [Sphingosinicella soli]